MGSVWRLNTSETWEEYVLVAAYPGGASLVRLRNGRRVGEPSDHSTSDLHRRYRRVHGATGPLDAPSATRQPSS